MLTASVENMLVASIDTTLETGVVPTQYSLFVTSYQFECNQVLTLKNHFKN